MLIQIKLTSLAVYMVDAGELTQRFKVLAGLSEDQCSIPTLKRQLTTFSNSSYTVPPSGLLRHCIHTVHRYMFFKKYFNYILLLEKWLSGKEHFLLSLKFSFF